MAAAVKIPKNVDSVLSKVVEQGNEYDNPDSASEQYYGFLVEIEEADDKEGKQTLWSVQFELVPKEWMEVSVLGYKDDMKDIEKFQPPLSPASYFVLDDATPETIASEFEIPQENLKEGEWYIITLGKHGAGGNNVSAKYPVGKKKLVKGIGKPVHPRVARNLKKGFSPKSSYLMSVLKSWLGAYQCDEVGVMDVGQASCNLVYDNQGIPQCYIDVGVPTFNNYASLPPVDAAGNVAVLNPGPCMRNNPNVILTHWHWDHYTMANNSANHAALTARHWVVPTQPFGGIANNVWIAVPAANRNTVPQGAAPFNAGHLRIIPCVAGPGIPAAAFNDTGLAVVVTVDAVNNRKVLLPGDAAYQSIPGLGGIANLRWMVASHHGSDTHLVAANIPAPNVANQGRIAYSYGITAPVPVAPPPPNDHCYGHPDPPAVADFIARGWGVNFLTNACTAETHPNSNVAGRGNIMMCNNVPPPIDPANPNCPFHVFPKNLV